MNGLEPLLQHVIPFVLVAARLAGLFIFTPVLSNRLFPRRFRALLVLMFSAALYPTLPTSVQTPPATDLVGLLPLVVGEVLIGLVLGFIAALPIICLDLAGFMMGHQMGLGLARVYNPDAGTDTDILGQLMMYLGLGTFLALGGIEVLFSCLVSTFGRVPPGGLALTQIPLEFIISVLGSGFELGVRVALPVVAIIFLIMVALGLLSKTVPQLNVMTVGFTIKIMAGLVILLLAIGSIQGAMGEHLAHVLRQIDGWAGSLGADAAR